MNSPVVPQVHIHFVEMTLRRDSLYEAVPTERLHLFSSEKDKPYGLRIPPCRLICESGRRLATERCS